MLLISANSIALILLLLLSPSLSFSFSSRSSTGLVAEEKARLGSSPPSCQSRCNMCHPCMAVQVPTTPSRGRVEPSSLSDPSDRRESPSAQTQTQNRYSNYKPLGWKCRCEGHLYNP